MQFWSIRTSGLGAFVILQFKYFAIYFAQVEYFLML